MANSRTFGVGCLLHLANVGRHFKDTSIRLDIICHFTAIVFANEIEGCAVAAVFGTRSKK